MSRIDDLINGWVQIKTAQASQPRIVQTAVQREATKTLNVNAGQRGSAGSELPTGAGPMSLLSDKRIQIGIGAVLIGGLLLVAVRS